MMRRLLRRCLAFLLVLQVTACAGAATPDESVAVDYGPAPILYEQTARAYLSAHNPYPASLSFLSIEPPRPLVWRRGGAVHAGYVVCVTYAGHVPAGAYRTVEAVLIRNEIAVDLLTGSALRWYGETVRLPGQSAPVCIRADLQEEAGQRR